MVSFLYENYARFLEDGPFLDLRWVRAGQLRGISLVSILYSHELLRRYPDENFHLITTVQSLPYIKSTFSSYENISSVSTTTFLCGDLFHISRIIQEKCVQQEPVYISFSNTIAIPFFSIFRQIIFTHDFAWSRSFRRSIGLNFRRSLGITM